MQESLFSMVSEEFDGPAIEGKTKITRSESLKVETIDNAEKLFDGFKTMKAITWSYGISMVAKQMRKFEDVELVFGCKAILEKQIKLSALAPLVVQAETLKLLQNKWGREISDRVEKGECRLYFENTISSHQKIYLLANPETEKYRVITGSANFSNKAWNGNKQKEVILVCDDRDSYFEVLEKIYEPFKATCATRVDSLKASLDELDRSGTVGFGEVPVLQGKEGLVILERVESDDADFSISMSDCSLLGGLQQPQVEKLESLFAPVQKGFAIDKSNIAKLQIEGEKIKEEHERRNRECPKLVIDWDSDSVSVNGKPLSCRQFEDDASRIVEFVNSFQLFAGDVEGYQSDAWKIMVWYFATPFFSHLRKECILAQQEGLLISLPMFLFLYGDANAGKTSLFKFLGKAMCGSVVEPLEGASFKDGSPSKKVQADSVRKPRLMQVNQKGLPILYDDVARGQMTDSPLRKLLTTPYAKTLDMEYDGYPAVVATSNITPPMPQEFQKRALFFQVSASLSQKQAIKNGQIPNRLTDEIGPSFFAEYVKRAAPKFKEHSKVDAISELDVYEISSSVILDIFRESGHSPKWATPLCIDDYFGEAAMCHRAAKNLKRYFIASRGSFERNTEENQLIVRCSSGDRNAENALKGIEMMLPPRFQSEFSPGMLTCSLSEIEKLCGMKFSRKAGWFHRFVK